MGEVIFRNKKGIKMNILTEDEALKIFQAEDSIANDEERWVTMNGRHVLIRNGEPVGLNISKATPAMKGGKFSKPKENIKKISAEEKAERKKTNHEISLQEERRAKELEKVDNELEEVDKKHDNDWRYGDAFGRAKRLGKEKLAERIKEKGKRIANEGQEERDRLYRKKDRIWEDTDKRQSALRQKNLDRWNKAQEKIGKEINKGIAAKQALEKARPKIQSAREANAYMKQRGAKISPLKMSVYKSHSTPEKEYKAAEERSKERFDRNNRMFEKSWKDRAAELKNAKTTAELNEIHEKYNKLNRELSKQRNILYGQEMEEKSKVFQKQHALKSALSKARPQIKQMRESVKFQKELDAGGAMPSIRKGQQEYRIEKFDRADLNRK